VATRDSGDLEIGQAALARGDWREAKAAFERAIVDGETPQALEGLGLAAWWLDLATTVFDARERAYRAYRERNDNAGAARVATWLAWDSAAFRGEHAIASGWLRRARRLLDTVPSSPEHAFLALRSGVFALLDEGNPDEAGRLARETIRIGQSLGLTDYEMTGRALEGFAHVTAGRTAEGLRDLDEVSAAILAGDVKDYLLMGLAGCYLIAACDRIRDYDRAAQWCDRMKALCKKWGLRPLFAVCRTQYASVCMWRGEWDEAERELTAATEELSACRPAMTGEGLVRLAELQRRRGKVDEAIALFDRAAGHPLASLGRAMIAFDRGDFKATADLADRYLRKLPIQNRTERAAALELLIRAHVENGNMEGARHTLEELNDIANQAQTDPLRASANLAAAAIAVGDGNHTKARRDLEDAIDLFQKSGAPFEMARARLELADVLGELGRTDAAAEEARRAIAELTPLHADHELARARAVLERVTLPARPAGSAGVPGASARAATQTRNDRGGLTARELEVLRLISTGLSNQAVGERLFISEHTVHRHVANTLMKLNVPSRSAAVAHAARLGLL
jgi:LuxR family maltose regulon positive regulatory protein